MRKLTSKEHAAVTSLMTGNTITLHIENLEEVKEEDL